MKTQNTVQLIGYLGIDPVMKKAINGSPFTRLRLATDYYRKTEDGSVIHKKTWHDVIAWDKLAESVLDNFIKGSHILVQGSIRNRTYVDKKGATKFETIVRASQLLNLDR